MTSALAVRVELAERASIRFFEDRHIDAQMRALIPRFARFAVAMVVLSAPLVAPDWTHAGAIALDALTALALTEWLTRTGVVAQASPTRIFALLATYVCLVAVACGLTGAAQPYAVLQLLPLLFASVFFEDTVSRYGLAVIAPAAEYAALQWTSSASPRVTIVRAACYLLLTHFGVALSSLVREALRSHWSLYSVLERATTGAGEDDLASHGLRAALTVASWQAGAVALSDGPVAIRMAAMAGMSEPVLAHYRDAPLKRGDGGLASSVIGSGQIVEVDDITTSVPRGHVLVSEGIRSMLGVPIPYQGETIGVLIAFHRGRRKLDARERDRLTAVAEQLGLALGSARAHRRETAVAESLRELNQRKDSFLAAVSHELRTPAATIELAARTLQRGGERLDAAERQRIEDALVSRGRDLRELIESLLDVALTESGDSRLLLEPLDWADALQRWTGDLQARLGRPVAVELPESRVVSLADPAKVERIVAALVSNAVKFSFDGRPVCVRLDADTTTIKLSVRDEGMGILPGDVEKIFDRFLQLDGSNTRTAGGLGIGLTLVRHFTALHGGRVEVESEPGEGSTFTVTLPRTGAD